MEDGRHFTKTLNEAEVGWVTEATETSVNASINV